MFAAFVRVCAFVSTRASGVVCFCLVCVSPPTQAVQQEENFFEKARRCVLRAIGVGRKSTHGRAGSSRSGSIRGGGAPAVAETAEEIEQRHKIKVTSA